MSNMQSISRHNERQNKEYGNEDIDVEKKDLNYHLKQPQELSYEKEFERLKAENNLKGNLRLTGKKQSNVACEFLITSDNDFFKRIGEAETKRYFEEAYKFACEKCGEKNIISAVVHMDETTPHMHLTYIPVVEGKNRQGEPIEKVNCSEFWKGFNSYGELQDKFYEHMKEQGFDLERGQKVESREERREHLNVQKYKEETLKERIEELQVKKISIQQELQNVSHEQENARKLLEEVRGSIKPLEEHKNVLESEIEEYKALRGSVVDGVVEHKAMMGFGKVKTVTMPKETYDACVSAQLRADQADLRARRAEDKLERVKRTSSHEQVQKLTKKVDDLEKKNRELASELKQHSKVTDLVAKVFTKFPDVKKAFDVVKIEEQRKAKSRTQGLDRGR